MSTSESTGRLPAFSSELIRVLIGSLAFALPVVVWIAAWAPLTSISAAYYTRARDVMVGLLFTLSAYLFAYKGHGRGEFWKANLGALAAVIAAVCPTSADPDQTTIASIIHFAAGAVLFLVTAYFCLGPFRQAARDKKSVPAGRRAKLYSFCGWAILACMGVLGVAEFTVASETRRSLALTFWGELVMLWIFSLSWLIASKVIPWLVDKGERLKLSKELDLDGITRRGPFSSN